MLLARLSEVQLGELKINAAFFEEGEDEGVENISCFFFACFVLECVFVFVRVCPEPVLANDRCFKHKERHTDRERDRIQTKGVAIFLLLFSSQVGGTTTTIQRSENAFLEPFVYVLKTIILPRQAWDEHRESTQNQTVFSQDTDSDEDELWEAVAEEMAGGRRPLDCQIKCVPCFILLRSGEYIPIKTHCCRLLRNTPE